MKYDLKIDEQFKSLIPPLSPDERRQLEENIVQDGCREPLCVWNNIILDGHNRYEICTRLGIPFSTAHIFLKTREDAIAWICANQLGRRNISEESRRYLIGKRYEAEKKVGAKNPAGINQHGRKKAKYKNLTNSAIGEPVGRTRQRLGSEYNVSTFTVERYGCYTNAIDSLSKIEPELASKLLSGKIRMTHNDIVTLSQLSSVDIKSVTAQLCDDPDAAISYIRSHRIMKPEPKRHIEKIELPVNPTVAIKEMPAYDPDASVNSLIFTVPSWISAIERTAVETDYSAVTMSAKLNLKNTLRKLSETAQTMLEIMEETIHEQ